MKTIKSVASLLGRLHRSEQGAEGLEKILIIAAIVIPLLGILLIYRRTITEWVGQSWNDMTGQAQNQPTVTPAVP